MMERCLSAAPSSLSSSLDPSDSVSLGSRVQGLGSRVWGLEASSLLQMLAASALRVFVCVCVCACVKPPGAETKRERGLA